MKAEMVTALLRATNDGAIPAPYPGEDTHDYRLRCALAGAAVAMAHLREEVARARTETSPGRPSDVTVTSSPSEDNPVQPLPVRAPAPFVHREPVHSNGTSSADEIGID